MTLERRLGKSIQFNTRKLDETFKSLERMDKIFSLTGNNFCFLE